MNQTRHVQIEGRKVRLSNLQKVLYPRAGVTKADVVDYYVNVADVLLDHLAGRAVNLKRFPEGVEGESFFERRCPSHRPEWVNTGPVLRSHREGQTTQQCVLNDLPSLIWSVNLGNLEMHTMLSRTDHPNRPTAMVFDLDPGEPATLLDCAGVAIELRQMLRDVQLESYAKTSGGKGLHLYVPLNTDVTFEHTKAFSQAMALLAEQAMPRRVVARMAKHLRAGKVYVDWAQNERFKSTVCVYSLRARSRPTVSTPVTWEEVQSAWESRDASRLVFETADVLRRVRERGDVWKNVLHLGQDLPAV